jgi:hypothetical protein
MTFLDTFSSQQPILEGRVLRVEFEAAMGRTIFNIPIDLRHIISGIFYVVKRSAYYKIIFSMPIK